MRNLRPAIPSMSAVSFLAVSFLAVSFLAVSLLLPIAALAQQGEGVAVCATVTAINCTGPDGMRSCTFRRNVGTLGSMTPSCATTSEVNANCSVMSSMYILTFNAAQTGTNPACQWNCSGCSDVTMDTSSGLPVELLDFDLEESEADDRAHRAEESPEKPDS